MLILDLWLLVYLLVRVQIEGGYSDPRFMFELVSNG